MHFVCLTTSIPLLSRFLFILWLALVTKQASVDISSVAQRNAGKDDHHLGGGRAALVFRARAREPVWLRFTRLLSGAVWWLGGRVEG